MKPLLLTLLASLALAGCATPSPPTERFCALGCELDAAPFAAPLNAYLAQRQQLEQAGFFTQMDAVYRRMGWPSRHQMHAEASQMSDPQRARYLNFYAVTGLLDEMVALYRLNGEALASLPQSQLQIPAPLSPFVVDTLSLPPPARLSMVARWGQIVTVLTDNMVAESVQWQEARWFSPTVTEPSSGRLP
ncbi:hypothetical protein [Ferrimonas balearica]|uniref:hypothetical protein n=1 Tax=Ferrimonas balearica TaxID=44012 RepID=UPI001C997220|nr:hypothetical protein [Ferrimonas balearica]MBY5992185.1 hypothetical protein [Ferrimonas balearica]